MSRTISATNLAEINASHLQPITMVKLEFDTPVYCHSGVGTITFSGNDYLGVGQLGAVGNMDESEDLTPSPLSLTLSGIDAALIADALNSGAYGDAVTIYEGYRQDDGTLVDDPWIVWKGTYEFGNITLDKQSNISITIKHDLAALSEKDGGRYSDEDQQVRFSGDIGFAYVTDTAGIQLLWGGSNITTGAAGGGGRGGAGGKRPPQDKF
ncbi:MAG: hypothetical protein JRE40_12510 [Deltaproteobacteria bacterium]|nr:hypothetical protein [Deltaproteobacteria bacterium]